MIYDKLLQGSPNGLQQYKACPVVNSLPGPGSTTDSVVITASVAPPILLLSLPGPSRGRVRGVLTPFEQQIFKHIRGNKFKLLSPPPLPLYRKAADVPVLLLLTVSLVSPTLLRHTPSLLRNNPKYGVFWISKKYDFKMFSLSLLCFQFEINPLTVSELHSLIIKSPLL